MICECYASSTELFCVYQFFFGNLDILLASIPLAPGKFFGVALLFVGYLRISHNIFLRNFVGYILHFFLQI